MYVLGGFIWVLCWSVVLGLDGGVFVFFFFQAEDGIRDLVRSRGLGDVYKRQAHAGPRIHLADGAVLRAGADDERQQVHGRA